MKKISWLWLALVPLLGSVIAALIRPANALSNSQNYIWGDTSEAVVVMGFLLFLLALLYSLVGYLTHLKKNTMPEVVVGGVGLMLGGAAGNLLQLLFSGEVADFQQIMLSQGSVLYASAGDLLLVTGFLMAILGTVGYVFVGRNTKASA